MEQSPFLSPSPKGMGKGMGKAKVMIKGDATCRPPLFLTQLDSFAFAQPMPCFTKGDATSLFFAKGWSVEKSHHQK